MNQIIASDNLMLYWACSITLWLGGSRSIPWSCKKRGGAPHLGLKLGWADIQAINVVYYYKRSKWCR